MLQAGVSPPQRSTGNPPPWEGWEGHSQSKNTCSPCNRAWCSQRLLCPGKATQLWFKSWLQSLRCIGPGEQAKAMALNNAGKPGQVVLIPEGTSFGKVTPLGQCGHPLAMGRLQQAKDTSRFAEIQGPTQKGKTPWGGGHFNPPSMEFSTEESQKGQGLVGEAEKPAPPPGCVTLWQPHPPLCIPHPGAPRFLLNLFLLSLLMLNPPSP